MKLPPEAQPYEEVRLKIEALLNALPASAVNQHLSIILTGALTGYVVGGEAMSHKYAMMSVDSVLAAMKLAPKEIAKEIAKRKKNARGN